MRVRHGTDAETVQEAHSEREVERLRTVYGEYMPRVAGRWDPDNAGNRAILAELERRLATLLRARGFLPLGDRTVLDVGCGHGHFLGWLQSLGTEPSRLHGIDLIDERIARARGEFPGIDFRVGNAEELPYGDGSFDLVMVLSVFTSILDQRMRRAVAAELTRVVRSDGAILWYDFRFDSPSNPNVRGIRRREVTQLFPCRRPSLSTVTLLPPLARRLGRMTPAVYPLLASIPVLRSHHLGLLEAS